MQYNAVQIGAPGIVILCSASHPTKKATPCSLLILVPGQRENENLLASW